MKLKTGIAGVLQEVWKYMSFNDTSVFRKREVVLPLSVLRMLIILICDFCEFQWLSLEFYEQIWERNLSVQVQVWHWEAGGGFIIRQ